MEEVRFIKGPPDWYPDWPYAFATHMLNHTGFMYTVDWCVQRFGEVPPTYFSSNGRTRRKIPRWWFSERMAVIVFRDQIDAMDFKLRWL